MANAFDEVIRLIIETGGNEDIVKLAEKISSLEGVSEGAREKLAGMLAELADTKRLQDSARQYQVLAKAQADLATDAEKAGLKLKLATEQEASAAKTLREKTAALDAARKAEGKNSEAVKKASQEQKAANVEFKASASSLKQASKEYERTATAQDKIAKQLDPLSKDLRKAGIDTDNLAKAEKTLASNSEKAAAEIQKLATQTKRSGSFTNILRKGADAGAASLGKLRSGVNNLGSSLLRITGIAGLLGTALGALKSARIFGGAVDSAVELQAELTKTAALAGASAEQMTRLKDAANDAGADYGVSAIETAQALTELVRASGDADAALAQLPATMALAKAGGLELGDAATIVVQTLSQFNLAADQASRVADVLSKTANDTTANVSDLGDAFTYAAPVAAQLGLSMEDTAAAIGALSQQGFKGSMAGTALRQTFIQLLQPASNFRQELRALGINTTDFNVVLAELAKRGDAGRKAILALGDRAAPAILALVNNGKTALNDLQVSLQNVQGEADRTAKSFTDNFAGAQGKLASALDKLRRAIVEKALGPIAEGFAAAAVKIREFIDTAEFQKLTDAVKSFAEKGVKAVSEFIGSFDFAAATEKITAFVDGSGEKFSGLFADLKDAGDKVGTIFKVIGIAIDGLKAAVFGVATAVTGFVTVALQAFQKLAVGAQLMTGNLEGAAQASNLFKEQIGGMNAVTEEFAKRAIQAGKDIAHAFDEGTESAGKTTAQTKDAAQATIPLIEKIRVLTREQQEAAKAQKKLAEEQDRSNRAAADLANAYQKLGIISQAELQDKAESNAAALATVTKQFQDGNATIEDVRRAYMAYAASARAAAQDSSDSAKSQVESMLKVKAAALGLFDLMDKSGDKGEKSGDRIASGFDKVKESAKGAADETKKVGDSAEESGKQAASAAAAIAGALNEWHQYFAGISDGASRAFQQIADGVARSSVSVGDYLINLGDAATRLKGRIADQKGEIDALTSHYAEFGKKGVDAFVGAGEAAQFSEQNLQRLIAQIDAGKTNFTLLGSEDLSGLRTATQAAIDKVRELKNAAKQADDQLQSIGESLQDQLDQINGDQTDIENRRFQKQLEQIKELAQKSGDMNSEAAREALARAQELHQANLRNIREEAQARQKAETQSQQQANAQQSRSSSSATSTDNTVTVRFDQQSLGEVNFGSMADVQRLAQQLLPAIIQQLKLAQQRSGRPG